MKVDVDVILGVLDLADWSLSLGVRLSKRSGWM